jgi:hypothetical protein
MCFAYSRFVHLGCAPIVWQAKGQDQQEDPGHDEGHQGGGDCLGRPGRQAVHMGGRDVWCSEAMTEEVVSPSSGA